MKTIEIFDLEDFNKLDFVRDTDSVTNAVIFGCKYENNVYWAKSISLETYKTVVEEIGSFENSKLCVDIKLQLLRQVNAYIARKHT